MHMINGVKTEQKKGTYAWLVITRVLSAGPDSEKESRVVIL